MTRINISYDYDKHKYADTVCTDLDLPKADGYELENYFFGEYLSDLGIPWVYNRGANFFILERKGLNYIKVWTKTYKCQIGMWGIPKTLGDMFVYIRGPRHLLEVLYYNASNKHLITPELAQILKENTPAHRRKKVVHDYIGSLGIPFSEGTGSYAFYDEEGASTVFYNRVYGTLNSYDYSMENGVGDEMKVSLSSIKGYHESYAKKRQLDKLKKKEAKDDGS